MAMDTAIDVMQDILKEDVQPEDIKNNDCD